MAIILPTKKLQSILQKGNESYVVFSQHNSGAIRVVGMTEYLKGEKLMPKEQEKA